MMTHSYYNGGSMGYDPYYRSYHRNMSQATYYDRAGPYVYHESPARQNNRSEYPGRAATRTVIQEPEHLDYGQQQPRKRISVACRRCRKRKIKCSGDLGDGKGCAACRHAGADGAECAFIRVGAKECSEVLALASLPGVEVTPFTNSTSAPPTATTTVMENVSNTTWSAPSSAEYSGSHSLHRPSLPILQTRPAFLEYGTHFDYSPADNHGFSSATTPRRDSLASTYGLHNYRSWSTAAPVQAPVAASYYEPMNSFGSLQAPSIPLPPRDTTRLPSVTADSFSPFHMNHMNSTLPIHTAYERRLPIPPPQQAMQYPASWPPAPRFRPLGSCGEPRIHINGIHSRHAMPWSIEPASSIRNGSLSSYAPPNGLPYAGPQGIDSQCTTASSEPVLGYQFSLPAPHTGSSSPDLSPTSGAAAGDSFSSGSSSSTTSIPPDSNFRYHPMSSNGYNGLPNTTTNDDSNFGFRPLMRTGDSSHFSVRAPPSLFSFSTDSSQRQLSGNEHAANDDDNMIRNDSAYSVSLRQHQLNHAASADTFKKHSSSNDQQRTSHNHCISVSNLNTNY